MRDVQFAGEYNLENCEIISSAGVAVAISPNIVEINIFENIFPIHFLSPAIMRTISVMYL